MKFLVALSCILAVASAGLVTPLAYTTIPSGFSYSSVTNHGPSQLAYNPIAYSQLAYNPIAYNPIAYSAQITPITTAVATAPILADKTQYHAQDILGQASYGHSEAFQAHNAIQDAAGNKIGSYSYVAPDGRVLSTNYVADALGYRVTSNALPVGPVGPAETPEVAAARIAHLKEHEIVKSRSRRSVLAYSAPVVHHTYAAAPLISSPIVAAPVVRSTISSQASYVNHGFPAYTGYSLPYLY